MGTGEGGWRAVGSELGYPQDRGICPNTEKQSRVAFSDIITIHMMMFDEQLFRQDG